MNQLSLPEPVQAKDIVVGRQGVVVGLDARGKRAHQVSCLVHVLVLVQLVQVKL